MEILPTSDAAVMVYAPKMGNFPNRFQRLAYEQQQNEATPLLQLQITPDDSRQGRHQVKQIYGGHT